MANYIVKSPLVIARDEAGRDVYLYQGTAVPNGIPAAELERLSADGFIEAVEAPDAGDSKPSTTKK